MDLEFAMKDIKKDPFEEYIKNFPPTRREIGEHGQRLLACRMLMD